MKRKGLATTGLIILFITLFYHRTWGLNLFILQLAVLGILTIPSSFKLNRTQWVLFLGSTITAFTSFYYHSGLALTLSAISTFSYAISLQYESVKSIHVALGGLLSIPWSYADYIRSAIRGIPVPKKLMVNKSRPVFYIVTAPVILLFLFLYSLANPAFSAAMGDITSGIQELWRITFQDFQFDLILYFVLGMLILAPIFYNRLAKAFLRFDELNVLNLNRDWIRSKNRKYLQGINIGLRLEAKVGLFLLAFLNVSLVLLLFFEIRDVWFGFSWQGEMLKDFVHQGIWILIISILISMGVALYFFRENQNFFRGAIRLKQLTYTWLGLNGVLAISAGIRTYIYIEHFALAYKRIGLVFFLLAVVVGLATMLIKIRDKKNMFYLVRTNSWSVYLLLVVMSLVNWDVLIAQYNLSRKNVSFVHLDFMVTLSDKALPYLQDSPQELQEAQLKHRKMLKMDSSSFSKEYMSPVTYQEALKSRTQGFKNRWEQLDWLEWNPAEASAYSKLSS